MSENTERNPSQTNGKATTKGRKSGLEGTVAKAVLAANGNGAEPEATPETQQGGNGHSSTETPMPKATASEEEQNSAMEAAAEAAADAAEEVTANEDEDDRFADVEAALALDDEEGVGLAAPQSLIVAIGKPPDFFMAHPDPAMAQIVQGVFGPGIAKPFHLVGANARGYLSDFMRRVHLQLCIDQDDNEFLYPIKLPSMPGADLNAWSYSALEAVGKTKRENKFFKLVYIEGVTGYKALPIDGAHVPPQWSGRTFAQIRNAGLRNFVVTDKEHPVAKWLRKGKANSRHGR